jgi:hypothetical protein
MTTSLYAVFRVEWINIWVWVVWVVEDVEDSLWLYGSMAGLGGLWTDGGLDCGLMEDSTTTAQLVLSSTGEIPTKNQDRTTAAQQQLKQMTFPAEMEKTTTFQKTTTAAVLPNVSHTGRQYLGTVKQGVRF